MEKKNDDQDNKTHNGTIKCSSQAPEPPEFHSSVQIEEYSEVYRKKQIEIMVL